MSSPLRVALTGGIATGKSHCLKTFAALGVPVVDADALAHEAVAPGSPGFKAVVERFGTGVLDPGGSLDRKVLGQIVFTDAAARTDLERILHPIVYAAIRAWFGLLQNVPFALADIPLLYETGHAGDFDRVIVAACPPNVQIARIMKRDSLSQADAERRLATQWPIDDKRERGDYVIDTTGPVAETDHQVREIWQELSAQAV